MAALSSATAVNTGATATIEKVLFEEVTVSTQPRQHSGAFEGQMPVSCCQLEAAEALAGLWQLSASLSHREKHIPEANSSVIREVCTGLSQQRSDGNTGQNWTVATLTTGTRTQSCSDSSIAAFTDLVEIASWT